MFALDQLAGRELLFLNWRDLGHPQSGGAETYCENIARLFAKAGVRVTIFTSSYAGAKPHEWRNEYLVIRRGGRISLYLEAARYLRRHGRSYDAIVDFQNGIPFFAPLWAPRSRPIVCVVHHVHQAQFDMYFPWPTNYLGRILEGPVTRRLYRGSAFVAVSPSTRTEMRQQLKVASPIHIVPNGIDPQAEANRTRSQYPRIAVVTRIVPHKRLHLLVEAIPQLLARWPDLRVVIAGDGPARLPLIEQVRSMNLQGAVTLPGKVSDREKTALLGEAWLTVAPSAAEGWGMTVIEANALGVPAVAFDVPGLRDSIRDGVTGWLVPPGQTLVATLAKALREVSDPHSRGNIADEASKWAGQFSWELTADRLAGVVVSDLVRQRDNRVSRRRTVDLATLATWSRENAAETAELLRKALRVTDVVTVTEAGVQALLSGCDEVQAIRALERVPIMPEGLRLTTSSETLRCIALDDR